MMSEESAEQLENLIESWQLNEADLNQTDIDAIKIILEENQELKKQLHEASLNIQEMTERDIYCPSSCDKLEELLKENQKMKEQLTKFIKYLEDEKDRLVRSFSDICEDKFDEANDILQKYEEIIEK